MPEVPNDLIKFTDVLQQYKPNRQWWEARMRKKPEEGGIQKYAVPGTRGIWLSKADVERLTRPRPIE